jgi:hypothetical protein
VIATVIAVAWLGVASTRATDFASSEDVPVPGGTIALAHALGIESVPDRPRFLCEIVRVLHDGPKGGNADTRVQLRSYLDAATRGTVQPDRAPETVPVPLTAALWSAALFHRPVTASMLFAEIVSDRRAALLAHGLAALDEETIRYLADHPAILSRVYEESAAAFAAFGDALRIHGGRVVPPGGERDVPAWESVLHAEVTSPERFVRAVFGASHGRLALVYSALAQLDGPHVSFALGSWMPEPEARTRAFKALLAVSAGLGEWNVNERPFSRPVHDATLLLTRVRVQPTGAPAAPAARLFWRRAFEGADVPGDPESRLAGLHEEGVVDAGWLAVQVCLQDQRTRGDRLDQLSFAQRAFAATPDALLPDALVAVRSLPRLRMLMLTLERMGVREPRVYAAAVRQASQLMALNGRRGFTALGQLQGALAVTARLARVHRLAASDAEALAASVAALRLSDDRAYDGGVARWIDRSLAPALQWPPGADVDAELVRALAGVEQPPASLTRVMWEGRKYRVDLVTPERDRLTRAREKMGSPSVGAALAIAHVARALSAQSLTVGDARAAVTALKAISAALPQPEPNPFAPPLPPRVEAGKNPAVIVNRAVTALSQIGQDTELKNAAGAAESLSELGDDLLARALMSLAYALEIGEPGGTTLLGGDPSLRHDFGFDRRDSEARTRVAWAEPRGVGTTGAPWHVEGSLLGLDVGLSALSLRRIDVGEVPAPPTLPTTEREVFITTFALINPFDLTDAGRDAIVAAIGRGRARVASLAEARPDSERAKAEWDQAADEIRMDGWRRRAGRWALAHDAALLPSLLSLTELVQLGAPTPDLPLDAWGTAGLTTDACLCTAAPPVGRQSLLSGRLQLGLLATQVADVNLRIAEHLSQIGLPASLARAVLAAAVQDFVDQVRPVHPNDWLTLARTAQAIPGDRIDDYVAALTADGPLVADRSTASAVRELKAW